MALPHTKPGSDEQQTLLGVMVEPGFHREVKSKAAKEGLTLRELVTNLLERWLGSDSSADQQNDQSS